MVPAYTAAAFAKRFARLGMSAPPAGAMIAIGFIHNLIRRHPSCMVLLHRPPGKVRISVCLWQSLAISGGSAAPLVLGAAPLPAR